MKAIGHYINGQFITGSGTRHQDVFNPATGEVTARVAFATSQELNQTIAIAKKAFVTWSQVTPLKRARVLFKFKDLLEKNMNKLAELLTAEHGKVLDDAKGEVGRAIELVEFMCGIPYLLQGTYS